MTNEEAAKILLTLSAVYDDDDPYTMKQYWEAGRTALKALSYGDEAKQKIVELADTCDKLNTLVTKYQKALELAGRVFMLSGNCDECWIKDGCDNLCDYKHKTLTGCKKYAMTFWKKRAGLE